MFNLLVKGMPWEKQCDVMPTDRILSTTYTSQTLRDRYMTTSNVNYDALCSLPALFVEETDRSNPLQVARVGKLTKVRPNSDTVTLEYYFDETIPPVPQDTLVKLTSLLDINMPTRGWTELGTTHWAVKDADLFRILLSSAYDKGRTPSVFDVPRIQSVDPRQLSVMMPFAGFDAIYTAIRNVATSAEMKCDRADSIWEHHAVLQDIVSLIDRSAIVICDCSGRNPNVFYEIGIAHSLGKEVILITQDKNDIPFDLIHLRYIHYLPNSEGLTKLEAELAERIQTLQKKIL